MTKTSIGEMPFTLAFGSEAVAPVEKGMPTYQEEHLDLLEERGEEVEVQNVLYKRRTEQYFNKLVKPRSFKVGNLVLKDTRVTAQDKGKLGPCYDGPYIVTANQRPGSYSLKDNERNYSILGMPNI